MSQSGPTRKMIIVLEQGGLYKAIQRNFAPDAFELVKAISMEQVRLLASIRTLRLVVTTATNETAELARALKDISADRIATLGLLTDEGVGLEETRSFSATAPADDLDSILTLACDLLDERRAEPRVALHFPVVLNEMGEGIVQNVSASGLLIHTMMPLARDQDIKVQVGWGPTPLTFLAKVGRTSPATLGQKSMALGVSQDETEARHFLRGLSDRIMDLHHYLAAWHPEVPDDGARLEDLVDKFGQEPPGPGTLQVNLAAPTKGPLLPETVLKAMGKGPGADSDDTEEEKEAEKEPEPKQEEAPKEKAAEAKKRKKEKEEEAPEPKKERAPRDKSNLATWALAAVVALALAAVVAWPKISTWQEQGAGSELASAPDMGPPPEPDASPEEIELSSDSRAGLMAQGRDLLAKKKYKQAIQALEQALFLEDGEDVRRLLAKIHRRTGNVARAIEHYEYLAQQAPEVAWFPDMVGRLHLQGNNKEAACASFRKAFDADPTYKAAEKNLKKHCKDVEEKK